MTTVTPITTENWGYPPYNRWSFQHVTELFPCARLPRGQKTPCEFSRVDKDLHHIRYDLDGKSCSVGQFVEETYTDAFLVLHNETIICEQYFNGMNADSIHLLNSVTKTYVGMLAGIAVESGQLDPEQLITHYLPKLDNSAWEGATIRQLLDMTVGAKYEEEYEIPETDFWHEAAVVGWRPGLVDSNSPSTLFEYARSLEGQDQANGASFYYRTVTTNVLGMVLEKVMNGRLSELLHTELWSKLNTRHDAHIVVDAIGFPYVGAGMNVCARDLLNFGLMMINDGVFNAEQVIPASWIEDTIRGDSSSKQCFNDGKYVDSMPGWHYRNQLWVSDSDKGCMFAIGIHGQTVYMDKTNGVVVVKLSSQPESVDLDMYLDTFAASKAIAEYLGAG